MNIVNVKTEFSVILFVFLLLSCNQFSLSEMDSSAGLNGSFEKVIHGLPANWRIYAPNAYFKTYKLIYDTANPKDGKQSLKFEVQSVDNSNTINWKKPGMYSSIDAKSGDEYKISFWIKNSGCKFKIKVGVGGGDMNSKDIINTKKDFTEWTYFEQDYTVPDHFPFFHFSLNILSPGTFWIDDVKIDKLND